MAGRQKPPREPVVWRSDGTTRPVRRDDITAHLDAAEHARSGRPLEVPRQREKDWPKAQPIDPAREPKQPPYEGPWVNEHFRANMNQVHPAAVRGDYLLTDT
jgi:hypothetical protein